MEGERLRVGAAMMAIAGACLALFGLFFVAMAARGVIIMHGDPAGPFTPGDWSNLTATTRRSVLLLVADVGLLGVLAGVGSCGLALFGVLRGEYWAWIVGVIAATAYMVAIVFTHAMLGWSAGLRLLPLYTMLAVYAVGLGLTRRFMT